jgi:hypothetical protein
MQDDQGKKNRRLPFGQGNGHTPPTEAIGWHSYQGWIGRLRRPGPVRRGPDTVYTWQGYQAWAARIRAKWDPEQS